MSEKTSWFEVDKDGLKEMFAKPCFDYLQEARRLKLAKEVA